MAIRMTGLTSGLDTENIIKQLVDAHKTQVEGVEKNQTKLEWKKEAWAGLNTKLYSFYTGALSDFKSAGTYATKKVTSSDETKATFTTSSNAINGTHSLSILQVASSKYVTGTKIGSGTVSSTTTYEKPTASTVAVADLVDEGGEALNLTGQTFNVSYTNSSGTVVTKAVTARLDGGETTLDDVIANMNEDLTDLKLSVSYDSTKGGFKFTNNSASATFTGGVDYTIKGSNEAATSVFGLGTDGISVISKTADSTVNSTSASASLFTTKVTAGTASITGTTKLIDMGISAGTTFSVKVGTGTTATTKTVTVDKAMTLTNLAAEFSKSGIKASYDSTQGRFFLNSTDTGIDKDFEVTSSLGTALDTLGVGTGAVTVAAKNAVVEYNGAQFEQQSNAFSLNGLNFTAQDVTGTAVSDGLGGLTVGADNKPVKITVATDTDAVYNAVKKFAKDYNTLIDEMNTLYSAARVADYEPLTDAEKEAMSDDEVTKWEKKIKDSLLRRDDTVSSLLSSMRTTLNKSIEVTGSDGNATKYALSSFGITTGVYTENGKLHIDGNSEDSSYAGIADKLRAAIIANPDAVKETLSQIGTEMYKNFQTAMKSNDLRSALTFYNDKEYDTEIKEAKKRVTTLQTKLTAEEDRYYEQFGNMETAMSKLNAQQSYVTQLMGSN